MYDQNRNTRDERYNNPNQRRGGRNETYNRDNHSRNAYNDNDYRENEHRDNDYREHDRRLGYRDYRNYERRYFSNKPNNNNIRRDYNIRDMQKKERKPKKQIPTAEEMDLILSNYMSQQI